MDMLKQLEAEILIRQLSFKQRADVVFVGVERQRPETFVIHGNVKVCLATEAGFVE